MGMIIWVLVKINSNLVWKMFIIIFYIRYWEAKCLGQATNAYEGRRPETIGISEDWCLETPCPT